MKRALRNSRWWRTDLSVSAIIAGFVTVLEATLQDSSSKGGVDGQTFEASKAVPARWIRYTARDNFGSSRFILTKELRGYGEQEPRSLITSVSGTYRMESIGELLDAVRSRGGGCGEHGYLLGGNGSTPPLQRIGAPATR